MALWPAATRFPVYVINLDRSPERWAVWERRWPDAQRIAAVDGKALDLRTLSPSLIANQTRRNLLQQRPRCEVDELDTLGSLGCSLSHVRGIDAIVASGAPFGIVLEDDAEFPEDMDAGDGRCARDFTSIEAFLRACLCNAIRRGDVPTDLSQIDLVLGSPFAKLARAAPSAPLEVTRFLCTVLMVYPAHSAAKIRSLIVPASVHIDRALDLAIQLRQIRVFGSPAFLSLHTEKFESTISHVNMCREEKLQFKALVWQAVALFLASVLLFLLAVMSWWMARSQATGRVASSSSSSSATAPLSSSSSFQEVLQDS